MDKMVIYISYDDSKCMNYYHVICDNEKAIEFCPEEKLEEVFNIIKKYINNADLCMVKSKMASDWDFESDFNDNEIELKKDEKQKYGLNEVCEVIDQVLGIEKTEDELELVFDGSMLLKKAEEGVEESIDKSVEDTEETPEQTEEILKNDDEEITEFARIIKEKYKRMGGNEHWT